MNKYIYLASPYSHPSATARAVRFAWVRDACAEAFRLGIPIFSPITHWHPIATSIRDFPTDFESFKVQNDAMLLSAGWVVVLTLEGWEESKGVRYELDLAEANKMPIIFWDHLQPLSSLKYNFR